MIPGRFCRLEPLDPDRHAAELYTAHAQARDGSDWTYLPEGPFSSAEDYTAWATRAASANRSAPGDTGGRIRVRSAG